MNKKQTIDNKQVSEIVSQINNQEYIDAMQKTITIMKEEYGDFKLTKKMRKQLQEELGETQETVNGWQTVVDVLDHIDMTELAKKHPEEIGKAAKTIASFIGNVFPIVKIIGNALPEDFAAKIIEFAGMATPEHIINTIGKKQLQKSAEQNRIDTTDEYKENSIEDKKAQKPFNNIFSKIKKPSMSTETDSIEKLKRLAELKDAGIITDEEYTTKKIELLSKI